MIAQLKQMRFSHALLSFTVLLPEKFIISGTEAVTMAATVEISTIWLYTSRMISLAFCPHICRKDGLGEYHGHYDSQIGAVYRPGGVKAEPPLLPAPVALLFGIQSFSSIC